MSLRACLTASAVLALLSACGEEVGAFARKTEGDAAANAGARSKNVVVFLVDTLRADHLGCYGYERGISPHIDAFADQGLLFADCLAQSTWTKPSTASVLTGEYPASHGATSKAAQLSAGVTTLAERLSARGLSTGAFTANGWVCEEVGFARGFETFGMRALQPVEALVDEGLAWIEARGDEPFFLYLHTLEPHDPYEPTAPYDDLDPDYAGDVRGDADLSELPALDQVDVEHLIALYDGEIAHTDAQFGRLLEGLARLGRERDTAVIFLSDHGEEFGDHGGWRHNPSMFREVVHVPLICRLPGLPDAQRGRRYEGLALQVDVVPTILQVLGLEPDPSLPGLSLLERVARPAAAPAFGFSEAYQGGICRQAVVAGGVKLVRQTSPSAQELVFDLALDPGERNVLPASDPRAEEARRLLDRHALATNAGFSITIQNGGSETLNAVCLFATRVAPLAEARMFCDEWGEELGIDGPIERFHRLAGDEPYNTLTATLVVAPGDVDGVLFVPAREEQAVLVGVVVDGQAAPPERFLLGPSLPASATPVLVPVADRQLDAPPFPGGEDLAGAPYRVRIWRNLTARTEEAQMPADLLEALGAMGYVGD